MWRVFFQVLGQWSFLTTSQLVSCLLIHKINASFSLVSSKCPKVLASNSHLADFCTHQAQIRKMRKQTPSMLFPKYQPGDRRCYYKLRVFIRHVWITVAARDMWLAWQILIQFPFEGSEKTLFSQVSITS